MSFQYCYDGNYNILSEDFKLNSNVIIEAYAVNKNDNTIVNEKGNRVCDREGITSEVSLWWIILYYFKMIFSTSKTATNMLK